MYRSRKAAIALGVLAALLWSPHFRLVERIRAGQAAPPYMVLGFYFLLGGALALVLVLFLTGRLAEMRLFNRRETQFLVLAASGGYGFWILRALSLQAAAPSRAHLAFYAAPVIMAVFSALTKERADGRTMVGLLLGFVGCIMLIGPGEGSGVQLRGTVLGLAAAACWAVFFLVARPLMRQERALPVAALTTGIGALFLLATSLGMRVGLFDIAPADLGLALLGGAVTVGFMMALWLKCLAQLPAALAGGLWYLGLLFGSLWGFAGFLEPRPDGWWLLGGAVLILLGLHSALSGRRRGEATMGDIIRGW
ncbi:MAG: DMT family transporter [Candidatus Brocadiia bacterium]